MEYQSFESKLAEDYDRRARQYRHDDEVEARTENHQRLGGNLRRICRAFPYPVRVLEIGCGTGRYFHWLDNVRLLVGTDISGEMLRQAEKPVHASQVTADEIRLIRGNIYELEFGPESFEVVYSLGMFGYGAALTPELCRKVHAWLVPGGRFYFDGIEQRDFGRAHRLKKTVKAAVLPVLPGGIKARLATRAQNAVPVFNHTRVEIERSMEGAGFSDFALSSNTCHSPLWAGVHLECCGRRTRGGAARTDERARTLAAA